MRTEIPAPWLNASSYSLTETKSCHEFPNHLKKRNKERRRGPNAIVGD
jgi:hypothetical protein